MSPKFNFHERYMEELIGDYSTGTKAPVSCYIYIIITDLCIPFRKIITHSGKNHFLNSGKKHLQC